MNVKLHPERCASIGREAELAGTPSRVHYCVSIFMGYRSFLT